MDRQQIVERIAQSSLAGLVTENFLIIGFEIEFIPSNAFWLFWQNNRGFCEAMNVRVYAVPAYRKPEKNRGWRVRVRPENLDVVTKTCSECGVGIDDRKTARLCTPCWRKRRERG